MSGLPKQNREEGFTQDLLEFYYLIKTSLQDLLKRVFLPLMAKNN